MPNQELQLDLFGFPAAATNIIPLTSSYPGIDRTSFFASQASTPARSTLQPGLCRHCGCTSDSCTTRDGDRCTWTDATETCCTAAACLAKQPKVAVIVHTYPKKPQSSIYCGCPVCSGRARGHCRRRYA